jgi:phage anti-repressor protein
MKNNLINVQNNNGVLLVSARELHEGLEISERFSKWFERMLSYGFEENVDYVVCTKVYTANQHGGEKEFIDYALKINMAKEIAMIQRNEKGKQVRKYFIECEQKLIANQIKAPEQPLQLSYNPYNRYNFKQYLRDVKVTDVPDEVEQFISEHSSDTADERLRAYQVAKSALEDLRNTINVSWQKFMLQETIDKLTKLIELQKAYIFRAKSGVKTKQINKLKEEIRLHSLDDFGDNYYTLNKCGFTINCAYKAVNNVIVSTNVFTNWQNDIAEQLNELPEADVLGFDPNNYMKLDVYFKCKENMDVNNLIKSFVDSLAERYGFDDVDMIDIHMRKFLTYIDSFDEGEIVFAIKNLTQEEIDALTDSEE